jgi:hypothetical protein
MKTSTYITLTAFALSGLCSCSLHNTWTIVGSGPVETMEVDVPEFTGVSVTGTCEVEVLIGDTQLVELSAQEQVLDVLSYHVSGGILHIGFRPEYNVHTDKEISATIVVPAFDYAAITGAGSFFIEGSSQPSLSIYITGTGDVDAFNMEVEDCDIRIEGAGNCKVNVSDHLDVYISGVGNVEYMGNPIISQDISGVGQVSHAGK